MPAIRLTVLGDSFVEGRGDPTLDGPFHGWVPRLSARLGLPSRSVLNLGTYQATTTDVVERQLPLALVHKAPLIGLVVGVNDLVRDYSPERFGRNLRRILQSLAGMNTTVFTGTYPDIPGNLPVPAEFRHLFRERFAQANRVLREATAATGTHLIDLAGDPVWGRPAMWSADGLHPSSDGHHYFAATVAELLERASDLAYAPYDFQRVDARSA
jgi:lysophospholipase L1-like esterase